MILELIILIISFPQNPPNTANVKQSDCSAKEEAGD